MTAKWTWILGCQLAALLVACDSETRNEPSPSEMCRDLVLQCRGLETAFTKSCYAAGLAGAGDPSNEDQCFASYPRCLDECVYLASSRPAARDAEVKPEGSRDAGGTDSELAPADAAPNSVTDGDTAKADDAG